MIEHKSLTECVVSYLKDRMKTGELLPEEELNEKMLCEHLGVSRTPIREAVCCLEREGLIEVLPHRSIRVKKLTLKDIENIYNIVKVLEASALEAGFKKLTDKHIQKMEYIYNQMKLAYENNKINDYLEFNFKLHNIHLDLSDNEILIKIINDLKSKLYDFPRRQIVTDEWAKMMMDDHFKLLQAFKKREKSKAIKIMHKHWDYETSLPFIIKYYDISKNNIEENHNLNQK